MRQSINFMTTETDWADHCQEKDMRVDVPSLP